MGESYFFFYILSAWALRTLFHRRWVPWCHTRLPWCSKPQHTAMSTADRLRLLSVWGYFRVEIIEKVCTNFINLYICRRISRRRLLMSRMEWVQFYWKAFTNAPSWRPETSQLSKYVQEWSNGRCLWVCSLLRVGSAVSASPTLRYSYRRGLRRCSFWRIGQCEGLRAWNE
jgi:hypothetical protein